MFPQRIHCSEDKCQPLGTSRTASRFLAIKKGLFISDYCWNPGHFLSSLPLSLPLLQQMQVETHRFDSETPDYSHFLGIPFEGVPETRAASS